MDAKLTYVLRLADTCLIHSQRLSEWAGHAPVLEEDLALSNIALDLLGQARALLTYAGQLEGAGRDEDQLAFLREERDYRNVVLVELPNAVASPSDGSGRDRAVALRAGEAVELDGLAPWHLYMPDIRALELNYQGNALPIPSFVKDRMELLERR